jgi:repressor LexA
MATDKRAVFSFITEYAKEQGSAPTIREIGDAFGIKSTNGVRHHLSALEKDGYITLVPRKARGIRVLVASGEMTGSTRRPGRAEVHASRVADAPGPGIPLLGRIAAGRPLLAEENVEGHLALDELFPGGDLFALRVQGPSMRDRGILDGDLVVVRQQPHAREGDTVVALVGDDATLKTFRRTDEGVELVPGNPDFQVLRVGPQDDFRVLGVVVGLVRSPSGSRRV